MPRPPLVHFFNSHNRFRSACAVNVRRIRRVRAWHEAHSDEFVRAWVDAPREHHVLVKPGIGRVRAHYSRRR
jgi:hypothetical protein